MPLGSGARKLGGLRLILASASPRRLDLLRTAGLDPGVMPTDVRERRVDGESPGTMVRRLAESRCRVYVPRLIDRTEAYPKLSYREYLNRSAFEVGRHIVGYEQD